MENNKITQEELEELNKFRLSNQQLIINFGQLEIELQNINFQKQYLISNLESLKKRHYFTYEIFLLTKKYKILTI
jgi:hypothetical protein